MATWSVGSTCVVEGITVTPCTGLNANFNNLTYNCPSQTIAQPIGGSATYTGNFLIQNTNTGSLVVSSTASATISVNGDFTISGGTLDLNSSTTTFNGSLYLFKNFAMTGGTITKTGTGSGSTNIRWYALSTPITQQYSKTGGTFSGAILFREMANVILDMGSSIIDGSSGSFSFESATILATLITGNSGGIASSGATGSIQVGGTRTFSTGANYIYNGSGAQVTGTGLPATINNLTIDNSAGVKLSNTALTVNGIMLINSGKLFTLESGKQLKVAGTLTNNAG
ncbi:MAG TPA: hypothetical protein VIJ25_12655, partial [Methylococcales bacterium]